MYAFEHPFRLFRTGTYRPKSGRLPGFLMFYIRSKWTSFLLTFVAW